MACFYLKSVSTANVNIKFIECKAIHLYPIIDRLGSNIDASAYDSLLLSVSSIGSHASLLCKSRRGAWTGFKILILKGHCAAAIHPSIKV